MALITFLQFVKFQKLTGFYIHPFYFLLCNLCTYCKYWIKYVSELCPKLLVSCCHLNLNNWACKMWKVKNGYGAFRAICPCWLFLLQFWRIISLLAAHPSCHLSGFFQWIFFLEFCSVSCFSATSSTLAILYSFSAVEDPVTATNIPQTMHSFFSKHTGWPKAAPCRT